jgi:hypothetical protein
MGYLFGKPEGGNSTNVGIIDFSTASKKLAWMNGLIAIVEAQNDPKTQGYSVAADEWK